MKFKNRYLTEDRKDLANAIRKGTLDKEETEFGDTYSGSTDGTDIQLQDRETRSHHGLKVTQDKFGNQYLSGRFEKSPRVSSNTWGRIWKNGELEKQFEGPKYQVRQDMAKYLDDTNMEEDWRTGTFDERDLQDYKSKMTGEAGRIAYSIHKMIEKHPEYKEELLNVAKECAYLLEF